MHTNQHPHNFGLTPNFQNIPEELRTGKWCVWVAKPKANGKFDKVPHNGLHNLLTTEPDQWLTYDQAKSLYEGNPSLYNGVGRLAERDGLVFVDVDTGEIPQDVKLLGKTYCEKSPSGKGFRIVYRSEQPPERDITSPFEIYSGNGARFLTITGNVVVNTPILPKNGDLNELVGRLAPTSKTTHTDDFTQGLQKSDDSPEQMREILSFIPASDEGTWFKVGAALHHQFDGSDEGLALFDYWSQSDPEAYSANFQDGSNYLLKVWHRFSEDRSNATTWKGVCELAKHHGADLSAIAKRYKETQQPDFFEQVTQAKEQVEPEVGLFLPLTANLLTGQNTVYWTIEDIIERRSLMNFYGESGVGKSYLSIDFGLCIATGEDWNGKRTKQGKVLYVAGEGHGGVRRRAFAWLTNKGIDVSEATNFIMTSRALNLTTVKDVALLERELDAHGEVEMVMIDTWGRATSGINENLGAEVQPIIERLADTVRKYNCTVCIVHHTPKHTSQDSAGSKNMKASMDVEMALVRKEGIQGVVLESRKMKEGEAFDPMVFKFIPVDLPPNFNDEYGKPMRSAVLELQQDSASLARAARKKLSPTGEVAYEAYNRLFASNSANLIPTPSEVVTQYAVFGVHSVGITEEVLSAEMYRTIRDTQKSNPSVYVNRGINDAIKKGYLIAYQHPNDPETNIISRVLEAGETG